MNKEEFINQIQEYLTKNNGVLTREDVYNIGVAHKTLPIAQRDWEWLASFIGWDGSGESLRAFIYREMKKEGKIKSKLETLSNDYQIINNSENKDTITEKTELLFKQQQKVRDEWSTYKRFMRDDARIENLKDAIKESVSKLNELPKYEYSCNNVYPCTEAILMISDLHIGVDCDNYYNKYNSEIARKRVMKLVDDTIDYCHTNNVMQLNVVNLGDLINGIIHISVRLDQEFDVIEQIMTASEILSEALNKLQEAAPKVIYRSVTDNHSRAMANKAEAIEKEQFSRLIDWFLKERLKDTKIEFADDNLDVDIGKFELLNGKKVMFAHGHNDNANQAFQHFIGATKEFIDYVLLAHFHSEKLKNYQGMKVFVNGSIVGTEQYASSKRLFSNPCQSLLIFDKDNVLNISIDLSNVD